jgi:putative two-component system response regulator
MDGRSIEGSRILIVDDETSAVRLAERAVQREGFVRVATTTEPAGAVTLCRDLRPQLLVLDLQMPAMDGFEVLGRVRLLPQRPATVLALTDDPSLATKQRALTLGADDYLDKPVDVLQLGRRVRSLIEMQALRARVRIQNLIVDDEVRRRTSELEGAHLELLERLALTADYRDGSREARPLRVGQLAGELARALELPEEQTRLIRLAAPLYDVGKSAVPERLLLKPGRLTPDEFEQVKAHTTLGARMLAGGTTPLLRLAEELTLTHHEHWDGNGYLGLAGEETPLPSRIVAVADVFDAITHDRPYKPAWEQARAIAEIEGESGGKFDPTVVQAFVPVMSTTRR